MTRYGTKDGVFAVKKLKIEDKIIDTFYIPAIATVGTGKLFSGASAFNLATTAITNTRLLRQPPYPLNIRVTANTAAARITDRLRVKGYDGLGASRYEDIRIASVAGSTYTTLYSYARITSLQPFNSSGSKATSACTSVAVGWGPTVGLPHPIATSDDLLGVTKGSVNATTALTVNVAYNQVKVPAVGADGTTARVIKYLTKFQK